MDAIQQFRITLWPGRQLPHPGSYEGLWLLREGVLGPAVTAVGEVTAGAKAFAVSESERVALTAELAAAERRAGLRERQDVQATGEVYLELEGLDLEDEEAILVFVNRFGLLGLSSDGFAAIRSLPWYADALAALSSSTPGFNVQPQPYFGGTRMITVAETLEEFRLAAQILRDLRLAYDVVRDGRGNEMQWKSTTAFADAFSARELEIAPDLYAVRSEPQPGAVVATFFERTLTAGLESFHPRVSVTAPQHRPDHGWLSGATVPFYATCCLELYNHIAEDAIYRRCENPTCGRLFVRQKGRSDAGQHRREGVKYCSNHCARAVAQRKYRERKRGSEDSGRSSRRA
jgi:hypothetical protein